MMRAILWLFFAIITNGVYSLNCYEGCDPPTCSDRREVKHIDHKQKVCDDTNMVCAVKKIILENGKYQTVQDCFDDKTADDALRVKGMENIFHKVGQCNTYFKGNYSICLCNDANLCNKASTLEKLTNSSDSYVANPNILASLIASFMFYILI